MRVLVSGSHGLIGTALVTRLEAEGHQVSRLVRPSTSDAPGAGTGPGTSVCWDPAAGWIDLDTLVAAGPFDAALQLAGAGIGDKRWTTDRRAEILRSRSQTTGLLARTLAALDTPPAVLVNASAIGIYGDRGSEILTEESPAGSGFLVDVCTEWERATAPAQAAGIRVVLLRTGIVLSAAGGALARQLPLFRAGLGAKLGHGRQYESWISLDDEVAVILRALGDDRLSGPVNATAPEPVTNTEFTRALGRALHRPARLAVPATALSLVVGRQMAQELLLTSQRVVPARLSAIGHTFAHPRIDDALVAVLGHRSVD